MDVEKVISEALFEHRGTAHDMASDVMNDLTANGLTVVSNEIVEALRGARSFILAEYACEESSALQGHPISSDARGIWNKINFALAKLDQPQ